MLEGQKLEEQLFYDDLGNRLKIIREVKGLTQASVAKQLGMSRTNYILIEQGKVHVSVIHLVKLSKILKVNLKNLLP